MSISLMTAIWDDETITDPTKKLLLLALADHANDDGMCWPSIARLAKRACISTGQTTRLISQLIAEGRITADRRGGRERSSTYWLTVRNTRTHARLCDAETRAPTPETRAPRPKTRAPMRAKPPITIIELEKEKEGEKHILNGGGGEATTTAPTATNVTPLPAEVLAAWDTNRWPLTDLLIKFLHNSERDYTRGELLAAIAIMNDSPKPIDKPAAYLKRVLQRRHYAVIDNKPADYSLHSTPLPPAPAPQPEPEPDPELDHAAQVQQAFLRALGEIGHRELSYTLTDAVCTNGNGYTVHVPAGRADALPWLEMWSRRLRDAMFTEVGAFEEVRFVLSQ